MLQPLTVDADAKVSVLFRLSLGKSHQQRPNVVLVCNPMDAQLLY